MNVFPKLIATYYNFFANFFIELFHGIYNQQINKSKTSRVVIGFFIIVGALTVIISGVSTYKDFGKSVEGEIVQKQVEPKKNLKKEKSVSKKPDPKIKKESKKKKK